MSAKKLEQYDVVVISKDSRYYLENTSSNPRKTPGLLVRKKGDHCTVFWSTNATNTYSTTDLELYKKKEVSVKVDEVEKLIGRLKKIPNPAKLYTSTEREKLLEKLEGASTLKETGLSEDEIVDAILRLNNSLERAVEINSELMFGLDVILEKDNEESLKEAKAAFKTISEGFRWRSNVDHSSPFNTTSDYADFISSQTSIVDE